LSEEWPIGQGHITQVPKIIKQQVHKVVQKAIEEPPIQHVDEIVDLPAQKQ